ncbi:MAG: hypothetical protein JXO49_06270 [Deltaproteobacteria bacterium]|nr:hypothetical protein [Candidatus Anaeroferrophillus wilburensis]MBN2888931.1 hypothetical protein [Deltaproteobacteria bacterium]
MSLFFPNQYNDTPYRQLYERLTTVERLRLLREFVGVTYERRFRFLQSTNSSQRFKENLVLAGKSLHEKQTISRLTWRHRDLLPGYLPLIFRHYLFGFLVQLTRASHRARLPQPSPSCYWETPVNLIVLRWINRHWSLCQQAIAPHVERVIEEKVRHLYIYCLLAFEAARSIFDEEELAAEIELYRASQMPGGTPIGLEMEFSNLGRYATFDKLGRHGVDADPFHNMEYYSAFMLEDVTWRLGGYVDTHVRGRRLFTLSRFGGFYEYSLVRVDYPRHYSLPLTTDPWVASAMIGETIDFVREIKPHSLHVNLENRGLGVVRPQLDDYLCLLMLGGDLGKDENGRMLEKRFGGNELRGVIQRRKHLSLLAEKKKAVVEYSFLRLWRAGDREYGYLPVIMALKGFQHGYNLDLSCRDQVQGMLHWAQNPRPLAESSLHRFVETVKSGLRSEEAYGEREIGTWGDQIMTILKDWNRILSCVIILEIFDPFPAVMLAEVGVFTKFFTG